MGVPQREDGELFAHSKQDIAYLLSLVEKQREALDGVVASLESSIDAGWIIDVEHGRMVLERANKVLEESK